jgi:predicted RNase H-like nuclease (RuvC/YqgF family)
LLEALAALAEVLDRLEDEREASRTEIKRLGAKIEEQTGPGRPPAVRSGEDPGRLRRQLAQREREILDLGRELRNLEDLRGALRDRTERLAQREQEVELLTHRLAVRNHMTALRIGGKTSEDPPSDAGRGA